MSKKTDFAALQAQFIDAAMIRAAQPENAKCRTIGADINAMQNESFKRQLEAIVKHGFVTVEGLQSLAQSIAICDDKHVDYVGLKVITKIRQCIYALSNKMRSKLDHYTDTILSSLSLNSELTNKSGLVCLSREVVYTETDMVQRLDHTKVKVSASTASTQLSSSRMMLHHMNICNVVKHKRNDSFSFKDSPQAHAIIEYYKRDEAVAE